MTNREFLTAIMNTETIPEDVRAHAEKEIKKLDVRNAQRSSKPSKKQQENEPLLEKLYGFVFESPMTAAEAAEAMEISTQKASALLRELVKREKLNVAEVSMKGKGKQKRYSAVVENNENAI